MVLATTDREWAQLTTTPVPRALAAAGETELLERVATAFRLKAADLDAPRISISAAVAEGLVALAAGDAEPRPRSCAPRRSESAASAGPTAQPVSTSTSHALSTPRAGQPRRRRQGTVRTRSSSRSAASTPTEAFGQAGATSVESSSRQKRPSCGARTAGSERSSRKLASGLQRRSSAIAPSTRREEPTLVDLRLEERRAEGVLGDLERRAGRRKEHLVPAAPDPERPPDAARERAGRRGRARRAMRPPSRRRALRASRATSRRRRRGRRSPRSRRSSPVPAGGCHDVRRARRRSR